MPSRKLLGAKGAIFGDVYLGTKQTIAEDVVVKEKAASEKEIPVLAEIEFKTFLEVIGGSVDSIIEKNKQGHEQKYRHFLSRGI